MREPWASYDPWEREPTETPMMQSACCLCGRVYALKPCSPAMAGAVSHGVCPECTPEFRRRMGLDQ